LAHIRKIKLKSGTAFQIQCYKNGKRFTHYLGPEHSYADARQIARELDAASNPPPITFSTLTLNLFTEVYAQKRQMEIDLRRNLFALKSFKEYIDPETPISQIDHNVVQKYRDWLLEKRLTTATQRGDLDQDQIQKIRRGVNKELINLRVIFNWARKKEFISHEVFEKVDFLPASPSKEQALNRKELEAYYEALPKTRIRLVFQVFRYTGLRRSEVVQIKRSDIDFEGKLMRIPKTKNRELNVAFPLHPELEQILIQWHVPEMAPEERIAPYHVDAISRMFRRALKKAGLEGKSSPVHIMRHTYVTRILKETKNLFLAQKAARHQSVNTTKRYEHVDLDDVSQDLADINF